MRHLCVLVLLVGCGTVSSSMGSDAGPTDGAPATPGSFVWQRNLFGSFPDVVTVVGDQLYVGASMFSALDLGNGMMIPAGGTDLMYARYTTDGVLESTWHHGAASDEDALGFSIDPSGNAAIGVLYDDAGTANVSGGNLPPVPPRVNANQPNFEGVAASFSDAGVLRWQVPLTGTPPAGAVAGQLFPRSASTSSTGLTAVTGSFQGTLNLGATPPASTGDSDDVFYAAFDAKGNLAALQTFGGTGEDAGYEVIFDPLDTVILVGTFSGKVSFGSFVLDAGAAGTGLFVVRMSPQGMPMWALQTTGTGPVIGASAATTPGGDVVVALSYQGSLQVGGGDVLTSAGMTDIALARVSSAGKLVWSKSFGGPGAEQSRAVAVGRNGDIALSAEFEGQVSFGGETFTSLGGRDGVVARYTGDGAHVWSHAAGSPGVDRGLGIAVDAAGAVYESFSYHGTIDFGGGPLTAPGTDFGGVVVKYSP
ncbi:MAG TPA: hypothetical protein VHW23_41145 [Kofleriaceae bacterium]|jgi:hypothetical protein|nr:hypothetical protein [Kofleriaceae bacterium]